MKNMLLTIVLIVSVTNVYTYYPCYEYVPTHIPYVPVVLIENNTVYMEETSPIEQQELQPIQKPKNKKSLFARLIRPPLRTVRAMTNILSPFVSVFAIYSGINLLLNDNDPVLTQADRDWYWQCIVGCLINSALNRFAQYAIEETE